MNPNEEVKNWRPPLQPKLLCSRGRSSITRDAKVLVSDYKVAAVQVLQQASNHTAT